MKEEFLENRAEAGMGGPNMGTFFDLVTAILKMQERLEVLSFVGSLSRKIMRVIWTKYVK